MFWPRDIWGKYAPALADFKEPANRGAAVRCLNDMVRAGAGARAGGSGCVGVWVCDGTGFRQVGEVP